MRIEALDSNTIPGWFESTLPASLGMQSRMLRSMGFGTLVTAGSAESALPMLGDWQLLRKIDCDLAQGGYVGKPMPAEPIPAWLERCHSRRPETVGS